MIRRNSGEEGKKEKYAKDGYIDDETKEKRKKEEEELW